MDDLVKTKAALEKACSEVRDYGLLVLDTECVWTRTYRPQLGIVQMGCRGSSAMAVKRRA